MACQDVRYQRTEVRDSFKFPADFSADFSFLNAPQTLLYPIKIAKITVDKINAL